MGECSCCDTQENLQPSHGKGGLNDVCYPCFFIWYDGDVPRDGGVRGEDIRAECLKAKAEGRWPFNVDGSFTTKSAPPTDRTEGGSHG